MTDNFGGQHKVGRIGIASDQIEYRKQPPIEAVRQSFIETWNLTAGTLRAVGQMLAGTRGTEEIGGPLRIAEMSGNVATEGAATLIWFMAVISINLGLINLFPIPLLDGGHLVFYLAERLIRRPLSARIQEAGAQFGPCHRYHPDAVCHLERPCAFESNFIPSRIVLLDSGQSV